MWPDDAVDSWAANVRMQIGDRLGPSLWIEGGVTGTIDTGVMRRSWPDLSPVAAAIAGPATTTPSPGVLPSLSFADLKRAEDALRAVPSPVRYIGLHDEAELQFMLYAFHVESGMPLPSDAPGGTLAFLFGVPIRIDSDVTPGEVWVVRHDGPVVRLPLYGPRGPAPIPEPQPLRLEPDEALVYRTPEEDPRVAPLAHALKLARAEIGVLRARVVG